jgi:DNA-binding NtrC family response regulator
MIGILCFPALRPEGERNNLGDGKEQNMGEEIRVLLLHSRRQPLATLRPALEGHGIKTVHARNCAEVTRLLQESEPPQLLFTDTQLPDGNWADAIRIAQQAAEPVNVIVVSRLVDVQFYIEVLQSGAFDFIAPPFADSELAHVVRCAVGNVEARRHAKSKAEQAVTASLASAQRPLFLPFKN